MIHCASSYRHKSLSTQTLVVGFLSASKLLLSLGLDKVGTTPKVSSELA